MLFPSPAVNHRKIRSGEFCQIEKTASLGSICLHWLVGEDLWLSCVLIINTQVYVTWEKPGGLGCVLERAQQRSLSCTLRRSSPTEGPAVQPAVSSLGISSLKVNSSHIWTLVNPLFKMYSGNLDRLLLFMAFARIIKPVSMAVINITIAERIWVIALMWDWARACYYFYSSHKEQQSDHFVTKIGTYSWKTPETNLSKHFPPFLLWKSI